jgi:hypothetical protein
VTVPCRAPLGGDLPPGADAMDAATASVPSNLTEHDTRPRSPCRGASQSRVLVLDAQRLGGPAALDLAANPGGIGITKDTCVGCGKLTTELELAHAHAQRAKQGQRWAGQTREGKQPLDLRDLGVHLRQLAEPPGLLVLHRTHTRQGFAATGGMGLTRQKSAARALAIRISFLL